MNMSLHTMEPSSHHFFYPLICYHCISPCMGKVTILRILIKMFNYLHKVRHLLQDQNIWCHISRDLLFAISCSFRTVVCIKIIKTPMCLVFKEVPKVLFPVWHLSPTFYSLLLSHCLYCRDELSSVLLPDFSSAQNYLSSVVPLY